jgi:hypothetical protein
MAFRRMSPIHKQTAVLMFAASIFCPFLAAQTAQSKSRLPSIEIFGGYSYLRFESTKLGFADKLDLNGANVELSLPDLYEGLGIVANVSSHYAHEMKEFNFLIGPQYSFKWRSLRLTGHALFGKSRDRLLQPGTTLFEPSDLGRGIALGGALDFPLQGRVSVRPIQADYLTTNFFGGTQHNIRLSTGLIFRFGKQ